MLPPLETSKILSYKHSEEFLPAEGLAPFTRDVFLGGLSARSRLPEIGLGRIVAVEVLGDAFVDVAVIWLRNGFSNMTFRQPSRWFAARTTIRITARMTVAAVTMALLIGVAGSGCESSSSELRSNPRAFLDYKKNVVGRHASKLTAAQRNLVMQHPGPNTNEIDSFIDSLIESNLRQSQAENSGVEIGESFRVRGESSPYFFDDGDSPSTGFSEGGAIGDGLTGEAVQD